MSKCCGIFPCPKTKEIVSLSPPHKKNCRSISNGRDTAERVCLRVCMCVCEIQCEWSFSRPLSCASQTIRFLWDSNWESRTIFHNEIHSFCSRDELATKMRLYCPVEQLNMGDSGIGFIYLIESFYEWHSLMNFL